MDRGPRFSNGKSNPKFLVRNSIYLPYTYQTMMLRYQNKGQLLNEDNYDP